MDSNEFQPGRVRRTVNDLVMAEMFLLQATIESASAIGDGLDEIGRQFNTEDNVDASWGEISSLLRRTGNEAIEPFTTRYKYFRQMIDSDS